MAELLLPSGVGVALLVTRQVMALAHPAGLILCMSASGAVVPFSLAAERPRVGELLRSWRLRRKLSQQALAHSSAVSTRYLSFIETGRARPSREMVLHLAERLEVPLRDRNNLLLAAGYAPVYRERPLGSPEMASVRDAVERFLEVHEPYPALIVDRHWNMVAANAAVSFLTEGIAPWLLAPPANTFRMALHPAGLAPRILNLGEWSAHALRRIGRQAAITGDPELEQLYDELAGYPGVDASASTDHSGELGLMHRLLLKGRELAFFGAVTTFGTATDITLSELAIEAFYPADEQTTAVLTSWHASVRAEWPAEKKVVGEGSQLTQAAAICWTSAYPRTSVCHHPDDTGSAP